MRYTTGTTVALGLGLVASVQAAPSNDGYKHSKKPDVEPHALVEQIYESDLREGAYVLQGIATENNNTRAFGTPGASTSIQLGDAVQADAAEHRVLSSRPRGDTRLYQSQPRQERLLQSDEYVHATACSSQGSADADFPWLTAQEFETYNYTPFGNSTFEAGGTVYPVATPEVSHGLPTSTRAG